MRGKRLAGPYIGALCAVTHDAKAQFETHQFVNYYMCNYLCDQCFGNCQPPLLWTDFSLTSKWRQHCISHDDYMAITPKELLSPWCSMDGFVHSRALFDWMHCVHLGCGRDVVAQVAVDICRWDYMGDGTMDQKLHALWEEFDEWCQGMKLSHSITRWTSTLMSASTTSYPSLSSCIKAAYVKPLLFSCNEKANDVVGLNVADKDAHMRAL